MYLKHTLISLLALLLFSCSSPSKEAHDSPKLASETPQKQSILEIEKGKIVNPVVCISDASQSYAAYLPSGYDATKKFPVLIFFDAHAGGRIPIEAYKDLAEQYNYIVVGSNNSKNGLDANTLSLIASTFMNDVKARFSIDEKRIYLSGFSGGARVAASAAQQGGVCGLASCSAGFQPNGTLPFSFIGFAGSEDFNSSEMIELDKNLEQNKSRHQLILYQGKHEWPSEAIFENAFLWFEFNAMKDKLIPLNQALIDNFKKKEDAEIKAYQGKARNYEAFVSCEKCINYLNGISDISTYQKLKSSLSQTADYTKTVAEKSSIVKREKDLQNYYRQAFQEKDFKWWNAEIGNLIAQSKSSKNSREENMMFKRSLSFLSLMCYMASNSMLNQNQLPQAGMYIQLYEKVDPENSEVYYMQALLAAKQQNMTAILPALQKAVNAGFIDLDRLQKENLFNSVAEGDGYKKLIEEIKSQK